MRIFYSICILGAVLVASVAVAQTLGQEYHLVSDSTKVYGYEPSVTVRDKRLITENPRIVIAWMTDYTYGAVVRFAYSTNRGVTWQLSEEQLRGTGQGVTSKVYDPTMTGDRRGGRLVFGYLHAKEQTGYAVAAWNRTSLDAQTLSETQAAVDINATIERERGIRARKPDEAGDRPDRELHA